MAELPPRLNIIVLLIAVTNLATEVVRLALEWSPSHKLHGAIKERMSSGQHDAYAWASDAEQSGLPQRGMRSEPSSTLGPWPEGHESEPPLYQTSRPRYRYYRVMLWCPDCRSAWRYEQRRDGRW